jgi:ABC-type thiamin/hydroxymethylpyrimidine transport system permease subunit
MRGPSIRLTRTSAALSILALAAAALSDFLLTGFWDRNAMVTSVVADILVLIVGVAVVNEFLAARARREWRLLSDYGLVELGETARTSGERSPST